jgi:DNA polymerase/3'-5' exonuclease PolX
MSKTDVLNGCRTGIPLVEARRIAEAVIDRLKPYCDRLPVAVGSIRRERATVNDVDIVAIPQELCLSMFVEALKSLGELAMDGPKIKRFRYQDISVDVYMATRDTWATLMLIRTGSAENNRRLCGIAKSKGWTLKASGEGLLNEAGMRIAGDSETAIYAALGVPYQRPQDREVAWR